MEDKEISYFNFGSEISTRDLQEVADFCEENSIEFVETYDYDYEKTINNLQQELSIANDKLEKIEEYVKENKDYTHDFTPSSPYYSLLEIIKGDE